MISISDWNAHNTQSIMPGSAVNNTGYIIFDAKPMYTANAPIITTPAKHYILMAGQRGYLPDYCEVYDTAQDAIDTVAELITDDRDLSWIDADDITADMLKQCDKDDSAYVDRSQYSLPYEYISIDACTCSTPRLHGDSE